MGTVIKLTLDNPSPHILLETKAWLGAQPKGRFAFMFTPKHGFWLNLIEGFVTKMVLDAIRVASKDELSLGRLDDLNRDPVVRSWTYQIREVV